MSAASGPSRGASPDPVSATASGSPAGSARKGTATGKRSKARPTHRERPIFAVAAGFIALNTLVGAFVAVQPGASRLAHVPTAVVVLVAVGLAAAFYHRLRAGLRACLAFLFGALSLVAAGIAIVDASSGGPSADDWTAFLLLPTGAALLALGLRLLWASRKPTGHRYLRRTLLGLGAAVFVYWVLLPISLAMVATEMPRRAPSTAELGRPAKTVTIQTADGLHLSARYVPSRNRAAVIVYPGQGVGQARLLVRNGYGVLLLDPRGYGASEGDANAYGWGWRPDLDAAVAFLRHQPDVDDGRIGGLGLSVGGEQMLEAAAENTGLKAVVSEGAGLRSVREATARTGVNRLQTVLQIPQDAVMTAATWVLSSTAPPPSLADSVARISPRATFFVYGEAGQAIERSLNPAYYDGAGKPKEIWQVPGATHTGGLAAQPEEYERRVVGFFDRELLDE